MALETFGGGLVKAAGTIDLETTACAAQGISFAQGLALGVAQLTLVEGIGESEFFAEATIEGDAGGEVSIVWDDATHFTISAFDSSGAPASLSIWFQVWRLVGGTVASVEAPAPPLLNLLAVQPLWASWLGGRLRPDYTGPLFTVRNDAGDDLDIGSLAVNGRADAASLITHCAGGNGRLMRKYNQVANAFTQIDAATEDNAPLVCVAGVPVRGARSFLASQWAGGIPAPGAVQALSRADSLGLVGAAALTLAGDMNLIDDPLGTNFDNAAAWIGSTADAVNTAFYVDLGYDSGGGTYIVDGSTANGAVFEPADAVRAPGWWQCDIAAAALIQASRAFLNGVAVVFDHGQGTNLALNLSAQRFGWGPSGAGAAFLQPLGQLANLFCWGSVLGAGDQALLNAWQTEVHC